MYHGWIQLLVQHESSQPLSLTTLPRLQNIIIHPQHSHNHSCDHITSQHSTRSNGYRQQRTPRAAYQNPRAVCQTQSPPPAQPHLMDTLGQHHDKENNAAVDTLAVGRAHPAEKPITSTNSMKRSAGTRAAITALRIQSDEQHALQTAGAAELPVTISPGLTWPTHLPPAASRSQPRRSRSRRPAVVLRSYSTVQGTPGATRQCEHKENRWHFRACPQQTTNQPPQKHHRLPTPPAIPGRHSLQTHSLTNQVQRIAQQLHAPAAANSSEELCSVEQRPQTSSDRHHTIP